MDETIPSRNPLSYCRLCLSQVNLLTTIKPYEVNNIICKTLLHKLFFYARIRMEQEDFPSAFCALCINQIESFHEFRCKVQRNHTDVRAYRRENIDEFASECKMEEEETYIDVIDEPMQIKIKEEEPDPTEDAKEVDVYHLDGELHRVVVKQEKRSPERTLPVVEKKFEVSLSPRKYAPIIPQVNILNKLAPTGIINSSQSVKQKEKRFKPVHNSSAFCVIKCSKCSAVFRSRENLMLHEQKDHTSAKIHAQRTHSAKLYKCALCNNSFIQETNYQEHMKTCQIKALAKINTSQITIKRARPTEQALPASSHSGSNVENKGFQCTYCSLTYRIKLNLQRHLFEVHKISSDGQKHYCYICKLNYSCDEDLQLHNRALHCFKCTRCSGDFRTCMHAQGNVKLGKEIILNKIIPL